MSKGASAGAQLRSIRERRAASIRDNATRLASIASARANQQSAIAAGRERDKQRYQFAAEQLKAKGAQDRLEADYADRRLALEGKKLSEYARQADLKAAAGDWSGPIQLESGVLVQANKKTGKYRQVQPEAAGADGAGGAVLKVAGVHNEMTGKIDPVIAPETPEEEAAGLLNTPAKAKRKPPKNVFYPASDWEIPD
jgi:hypothetical protein